MRQSSGEDIYKSNSSQFAGLGCRCDPSDKYGDGAYRIPDLDCKKQQLVEKFKNVLKNCEKYNNTCQALANRCVLKLYDMSGKIECVFNPDDTTYDICPLSNGDRVIYQSIINPSDQMFL